MDLCFKLYCVYSEKGQLTLTTSSSDKPSLLSCYLTATVEDYAESSGNNGCTVQLGNWAPLTWSCTQTTQPGTSKDKYYMQVHTHSYGTMHSGRRLYY